MFRRKPKSKSAAVESESDFRCDLAALGLAINTDLDCIRQTSNPDEPFDYFHYGKSSKIDGSGKQERLNERRREAVDECLRRLALSRLQSLFPLIPLHLPDTTGPTVPILVSTNLNAAKKILLIAPPTTNSALGVLSLRVMQDERISMGSMETLLSRASGIYDGFIIANPGCLCWDKFTSTAMSHTSYKARPVRQVAPSAILDDDENVIPGHESPENHVAAVFEHLKTQLDSAAKVDVLAVGYSAYAVVHYLQAHWGFWGEVMHTGFFADSSHTASRSQVVDDGFRRFLRERVRNYVTHSDPVGNLLDNVSARLGCACFTAGETWGPRIVPVCIDQVVGYLESAWGTAEGLNPEIGGYREGAGDGKVVYEGEWMDKLRRLDLGSTQPGWDVPGMEEVMRLKEQAMRNELDAMKVEEVKVEEVKIKEVKAEEVKTEEAQ